MGVIANFRDISKEVRLREQLQKAQQLAALGEMAAAVAHEIRNPLGIIKSSAELLKKRMMKLDPDSTIPDIIVEEAVRLDSIIKDFLDFAKPRHPNLRPCRVEEIIEKNLAFLNTQIQDNAIEIERQYSNGTPEIIGDGPMLYQAFLNILLNAFQSMPSGGTLTIGLFSRCLLGKHQELLKL